jgi:hypothetical protein
MNFWGEWAKAERIHALEERDRRNLNKPFTPDEKAALEQEIRAINAPRWAQDRAKVLAGEFDEGDWWPVIVGRPTQDRWHAFVPIALAEHLDLNGYGVGHE